MHKSDIIFNSSDITSFKKNPFMCSSCCKSRSHTFDYVNKLLGQELNVSWKSGADIVVLIVLNNKTVLVRIPCAK